MRLREDANDPAQGTEYFVDGASDWITRIRRTGYITPFTNGDQRRTWRAVNIGGQGTGIDLSEVVLYT